MSLLFLRMDGIFRLKRLFGGILRLSVEIYGNISLYGTAMITDRIKVTEYVPSEWDRIVSSHEWPE